MAASKVPGPSVSTRPSGTGATDAAGGAGTGSAPAWAHASSWPAAAQSVASASTRRTVRTPSPRAASGSGTTAVVCGATSGIGRVPPASDPLDAPLEREPVEAAEVEGVLDLDRLAALADREVHRLVGLLEVGEAGPRRPVGVDEAVRDEVPVVQRLAEVPAVREPVPAVGGGAPDAVLEPLPDEPALGPRVPPEARLVLVDPAGPVAHRVDVLALQERQRAAVRIRRGVGERLLRLAPDRVHLVGVRVHPRVDVDVGARPVALVVHGPRGVELVRHPRRRLEVAPGAGLVAERPEDHARVVAVARDRAGHAVDVGRLPRRVVARVAPPPDVDEPVRLEVALVDEVEAELVREPRQVRMRRVVGRADRVHVVLLHQQQLARARPPAGSPGRGRGGARAGSRRGSGSAARSP